jgi:hypothetical protein
MIYLIYSKNFCKCHDVPPSSTTIRKKMKYGVCVYSAIKNEIMSFARKMDGTGDHYIKVK